MNLRTRRIKKEKGIIAGPEATVKESQKVVENGTLKRKDNG